MLLDVLVALSQELPNNYQRVFFQEAHRQDNCNPKHQHWYKEKAASMVEIHVYYVVG